MPGAAGITSKNFAGAKQQDQVKGGYADEKLKVLTP
jgi:hypothetical protein